MRVIGNQCIGGLQDDVAGAVILFQLDQFQIGIIALQRLHVLRPGATPGINGLVVITHHGQAVAWAYQQLYQQILTGVGVLVFVHQQVVNAVLPAFEHLRILLKQRHR